MAYFVIWVIVCIFKIDEANVCTMLTGSVLGFSHFNVYSLFFSQPFIRHNDLKSNAQIVV